MNHDEGEQKLDQSSPSPQLNSQNQTKGSKSQPTLPSSHISLPLPPTSSLPPSSSPSPPTSFSQKNSTANIVQEQDRQMQDYWKAQEHHINQSQSPHVRTEKGHGATNQDVVNDDKMNSKDTVTHDPVNDDKMNSQGTVTHDPVNDDRINSQDVVNDDGMKGQDTVTHDRMNSHEAITRDRINSQDVVNDDGMKGQDTVTDTEMNKEQELPHSFAVDSIEVPPPEQDQSSPPNLPDSSNPSPVPLAPQGEVSLSNNTSEGLQTSAPPSMVSTINKGATPQEEHGKLQGELDQISQEELSLMRELSRLDKGLQKTKTDKSKINQLSLSQSSTIISPPSINSTIISPSASSIKNDFTAGHYQSTKSSEASRWAQRPIEMISQEKETMKKLLNRNDSISNLILKGNSHVDGDMNNRSQTLIENRNTYHSYHQNQRSSGGSGGGDGMIQIKQKLINKEEDGHGQNEDDDNMDPMASFFLCYGIKSSEFILKLKTLGANHPKDLLDLTKKEVSDLASQSLRPLESRRFISALSHLEQRKENNQQQLQLQQNQRSAKDIEIRKQNRKAAYYKRLSPNDQSQSQQKKTSIYDRLYSDTELREKHLKKLRKEHDKNSEYTFTPKLEATEFHDKLIKNKELRETLKLRKQNDKIQNEKNLMNEKQEQKLLKVYQSVEKFSHLNNKNNKNSSNSNKTSKDKSNKIYIDNRQKLDKKELEELQKNEINHRTKERIQRQASLSMHVNPSFRDDAHDDNSDDDDVHEINDNDFKNNNNDDLEDDLEVKDLTHLQKLPRFMHPTSSFILNSNQKNIENIYNEKQLIITTTPKKQFASQNNINYNLKTSSITDNNSSNQNNDSNFDSNLKNRLNSLKNSTDLSVEQNEQLHSKVNHLMHQTQTETQNHRLSRLNGKEMKLNDILSENAKGKEEDEVNKDKNIKGEKELIKHKQLISNLEMKLNEYKTEMFKLNEELNEILSNTISNDADSNDDSGGDMHNGQICDMNQLIVKKSKVIELSHLIITNRNELLKIQSQIKIFDQIPQINNTLNISDVEDDIEDDIDDDIEDDIEDDDEFGDILEQSQGRDISIVDQADSEDDDVSDDENNDIDNNINNTSNRKEDREIKPRRSNSPNTSRSLSTLAQEAITCQSASIEELNIVLKRIHEIETLQAKRIREQRQKKILKDRKANQIIEEQSDGEQYKIQNVEVEEKQEEGVDLQRMHQLNTEKKRLEEWVVGFSKAASPRKQK